MAHLSNITPAAMAMLLAIAGAACSSGGADGETENGAIALGDRPMALAATLPDSPLREQLLSCDTDGIEPSLLSIGHRGAPLNFPEHTRESYLAAAAQGAGVIECDVTFTKDRALVCRHSQCDLHTSTDILNTSLADTCRVPPDFNSDAPFADVECCTSDLTLNEFQTLRGKRDGGDRTARTVDAYFAGTPGWSEDTDSNFGELLTHQQSIDLFDALGVAMTPELKLPEVPMPYQGDYTQEAYASQMLNDYIDADIDPGRVFPQSFELSDIQFWLRTMPDIARQAVYLDGRYRNLLFDINNAESWVPSMEELVANSVQYLASPIWMLLSIDAEERIVPSEYARAASTSGLSLIAWTLERSGSIVDGDNWYYQSIQSAISSDGDVFTVIDVLVEDVGVVGIFSDWPATVSYYVHCVN